MRLLAVEAGIVAVALWSACGNDSTQDDGLSSSSPSGGSNTSACEALGREKPKEFFVVLSDGDVTQIEQMFPESMSGWQLQLSPGVLDAGRWAKANSTSNLIGQSGVGELPSFDAFNRSQVAGVVSQLRGLDFVGQAIGDGVTVQGIPAFPFYNRALYGGELSWRAVGEPLEALGWTGVDGGGKVSMDCETGMFVRILLSPLEFEEGA